MAASLNEIRQRLDAGRAVSSHKTHLEAEEEFAFAGAETLFEHAPKPKLAAAPIEMQRRPFEVDAPLTPAVVPCGQDTVARDTLNGIKKGEPVTVAEMMTRNDFLNGQFSDYTGTYYFSGAALVCGLVSMIMCFYSPWIAALFAVFSGYSYGMYLWKHYWAIDYMKVRTIMIPT